MKTATEGIDRLPVKRHIAEWLVGLLRRQFGVNVDGVLYEIGVKQGMLTEQILDMTGSLRVVGVDRWAPAGPDDDYRQIGDPAACAPAEEHEAWSVEAARRIHRFDDRARLWRAESVTVVAGVADSSLIGVFLDADHSFDARRADLHAWMPKVMRHGVVAGGLWRSSYGGDCCERAVREFLDVMGWNAAVEFGPEHTWAFVRP